MGQDGACYEFTRYPLQIDALGVLQANRPIPSQAETFNHGASTSMADGIGNATKPHDTRGAHQLTIDKLFVDLGVWARRMRVLSGNL